MILKKNKSKFFSWLMLLLIVVLAYFGLRNDAMLYSKPIVQVEKVKVVNKNNSTDEYSNHVINYQQKVQVKFLNTQKKGQKIWLKNTYDSSQGLNQELKTRMQIFLRQQDNSWSFENVKRDALCIPIIIVLVGILINIMSKAGYLTSLSLCLNSILFVIAIWFNLKTGTHYLLPIFILFSLLVSALTLGLVIGFKNRQTWIIFATVVTSTCIAMLLAVLVFKLDHNQDVNFELLGFITQLPMPMFFSMTLVGVLGAVMDEATDMISTLFALIDENTQVTMKELMIAGRHVGQEIFGALTNVLFLIFIAEQIPMAILFLRNGNNIGYTYDMNMALGMIQTLISAIGIVLTVPAGILWVSIDRKYEMHRKES